MMAAATAMPAVAPMERPELEEEESMLESELGLEAPESSGPEVIVGPVWSDVVEVVVDVLVARGRSDAR